MILNVDPQLSQWDVDRIVVVSDTEATHMHFANPGDSKAVIMEIVGGEVQIPNYLLQTGKSVIAYAVLDGVTVGSKTFPVRKRERPENYVYEEDRRNYIYELISNAQNAADRANEAADRMNAHVDDSENPHRVTPEQIGAVSSEDYNTFVGDVIDHITSVEDNLTAHSDRKDNPHNVTCEQIGAVHKDDFEAEVIAALDLYGGVDYSEVVGHIYAKNNPHKVTPEQIGAATTEQVADLQVGLFNLNANANKNGYIDSDNATFVASSSFRTTEPIFVKGGTVIKYRLLHGSNKLPQIVLYANREATEVVNIDGVAAVVMGKNTVQESEYTVPADGYIRLVNYTTLKDGYVLFTDAIPDNVRVYADSKSAEAKAQAESVSFSIYNNYSNGYLKANGGFVANDKVRTTDPFYVTANMKFKYRLKRGAANIPIIVLYANKEATNVIDTVIGGIEAIEGEYTVPSNGYIRFVYYHDYADGYVMFTDSIADNVRMYVDKAPDATNPTMKILVMGDSIMGTDEEIVQYLSQLTHAKVINGAFGGTRVVARASTDAIVPNLSAFDGENLVASLASQDWTTQYKAYQKLYAESTGYSWINSRLANLTDLDMSTVSLVVMNWGTNDYTAGSTKQTILDSYNSVIDTLQYAYPELRILITTPIWRYFDSTANGDNKVYNDATLKEISEAIENFAKEKRISVLNAYQNMPLSYNTASTYFDDGDGAHLNAKGNMVYAHLLNGKIRTLY